MLTRWVQGVVAPVSAPGDDKFHYKPSTLRWNQPHTHNNMDRYCYCGGVRTDASPMLQCGCCRQYFHTSESGFWGEEHVWLG